MRLLVISHACITPINQSFYADVERLTGWEVSLVMPASWNSEYKAKLTPVRWKDFGGAIYPIPVWQAGDVPLHVYKETLVGLLRNVRPDAIYVHHEPYGLATAQVYLANRLVDNVPIGFYAAQNILKEYPAPFRWFERWVLGRSAFALPVTEGALEVLRAKGYTGAAEVLPLPVAPGVYCPKPAWAGAKRAELGIGEGEFVMGYVGRLVEEKGLDALLRGAVQLRGRRWRVVFVGSGPYEAQMRKTIAELGLEGNAIFVGFVPHEEAGGWLTLFDVLVLTSETRPNWKEQFGRVIVEANACGTPVIGTESGEIGARVRETGGGVLVPEADPAALGAAMMRLAEHPETIAELGQRGMEAVKQKYDQSYLASRLVAAIEAAVARRVQ